MKKSNVVVEEVKKEKKVKCTRCKRSMNYRKPNRLCWDCDDYSVINNM